jgi:hypothetical protein
MLRLSGRQVESLFDLGLAVALRVLPADPAALDCQLTDPRLVAPADKRRWTNGVRSPPATPDGRTAEPRRALQRRACGWEPRGRADALKPLPRGARISMWIRKSRTFSVLAGAHTVAACPER